VNAVATPLQPSTIDATLLGEPDPPSLPGVERDDIDRIPVIYIAGAYSADDPWGVEQNVRRAEEAAYELEALGAATVCPHTNTRFQDNRTPYEQKIKTTLATMRRCDAVFFLRGWMTSAGARGEYEAADRRGMPTLLDMTAARAFIDSRLGRRP
jgi:hypothetical protein